MSSHQQTTIPTSADAGASSSTTTMMFTDMPSQQHQTREIGESSLKQPLHLEDHIHSMKELVRQQQQILDELQEQVSYENEVGKDLLRMGKTKTALYHFSKGLQCIQRLSLIKKRMEAKCCSGVEKVIPVSSSSGASTTSVLVPGTRLGRALPIDTLSTASKTEKWEVFSSLAIIHNSALAHHQDRSYNDAKQMLSLGIKLLRSDLSSPADLNRLLKSSQYASTVVVSLYAILGKTLKMLSPNGTITKEAKKALTAAAGLHKRFLPNAVGGGTASGSSRSLGSTNSRRNLLVQEVVSCPVAAAGARATQMKMHCDHPQSAIAAHCGGVLKLSPDDDDHMEIQQGTTPLSPSTVMSMNDTGSVRSRTTISTLGNGTSSSSSNSKATAVPPPPFHHG